MEKNLRWARNSEFQDLPEINVGDQVILHAECGFQYNIKADVLSFDSDKIIALIFAFFDRHTGEEVGSTDIAESVGKVVGLERAHVFAVLKP